MTDFCEISFSVQERTHPMQNLKEKFQRFMIGRYGADQLGRFLSIVIVILAAVSFFIRSYWFGSLIRSVLIILLAILYFRIFSRNITRRSQENNAYIRLHFQVSERLKGWRFHLEERRRYKIFSCLAFADILCQKPVKTGCSCVQNQLASRGSRKAKRS